MSQKKQMKDDLQWTYHHSILQSIIHRAICWDEGGCLFSGQWRNCRSIVASNFQARYIIDTDNALTILKTYSNRAFKSRRANLPYWNCIVSHPRWFVRQMPALQWWYSNWQTKDLSWSQILCWMPRKIWVDSASLTIHIQQGFDREHIQTYSWEIPTSK